MFESLPWDLHTLLRWFVVGGEEGVSSCSKRHALNVTTVSMQRIAYIYVL
jgi:hypothetical protein